MNKEFIKGLQGQVRRGRRRPTRWRPPTFPVYLWKNTGREGKSVRYQGDSGQRRRRDVRRAGGLVTIDGENHHITKTAGIGEIHPDGLIYTVWDVAGTDRAGPVPEVYPWAAGLSG